MASQRNRPRFAIIIPARYASTRFPGKPLARLRGSTGEAKSLIQRSWECAVSITDASSVWVAVDDERIADAVTAFGGQIVMTSPECRNGTERCAEAVNKLGPIADVIVNLQGDAPLTPHFIAPKLVDALEANPGAAMATAAVNCSATLYRHLVNDQAQGRVGGTTVTFSQSGEALYFSKRVIPYVSETETDAHKAVHLHLGIYAYRPEALRAYAELPPFPLELREGLEQLRFLEGGLRIQMARFAPLAWDCIELNNPQDVPVIEAILNAQRII